MIFYPPDDPFLINNAVFGIPIVIRWYGVLIMSGAMLGTWLAARRARHRGHNPDHVWNILTLGLLMGIAGARIYYVIFEWSRFGGDLGMMIDITRGGLAIHGAIIGAMLTVIIYTRVKKLSFWEWSDLFMPGFLLAQSIGRWGNFFNQEAYGVPTTLGFGVRIDGQHRLPDYPLSEYPPDTLFHPTFLYESLWNLTGVGLLLLLDRWYGTHEPARKRWLRHGDLLFIYAIFYSLGRFWIEGLRTDSLYIGPLRTAQVVSLVLIGAGIVALFVNHRRKHSHADPKHEPTSSPK
jgi:phosphatidylglycerol:prolipoprotein diacylglycerol transferase